MNKKDWKKTKKTGGFKRKLKKEYNDFINNWSKQKKLKIIDVLKKQNTIEELEVLCEISTSQAVSSRNSGEKIIEENNCIANLWCRDLCEPSTSQAVSLRDSGDNSTEGDNCVANVLSEDYSSSDDEEVCTEYMKDLIERNKIREWAVVKNITQSALRDLASILNERYPGILPDDPRTLLKTPRQVSIKVVEPGTYWHNGVVEPLKIIF